MERVAKVSVRRSRRAEYAASSTVGMRFGGDVETGFAKVRDERARRTLEIEMRRGIADWLAELLSF